METAISVLAWTLAVIAVVVGIPMGAYYFSKKEFVDAQTEAIKEDTRFRTLPSQTGTPR